MSFYLSEVPDMLPKQAYMNVWKSMPGVIFNYDNKKAIRLNDCKTNHFDG